MFCYVFIKPTDAVISHQTPDQLSLFFNITEFMSLYTCIENRAFILKKNNHIYFVRKEHL